MKIPVDFEYAIQKQLSEIVKIKQEQSMVVLSGKDKRLEQHVSLMKDAVIEVKNTTNKTEEESNLRRWISTEFDSLLKSIKDEFNKKNFKLIDYIWNEYNIAVWICKSNPSILCMRVEGVNIAF